MDCLSSTTSMASRRRSTRSVRQSLESSTAARFRLPLYSSSLASNLVNRVSASAAEPAKPASTWPPCMLRILTASPFMTVWPKVTCPSPARALWPRWRTARIVVPWMRGALAMGSVRREVPGRLVYCGVENERPSPEDARLGLRHLRSAAGRAHDLRGPAHGPAVRGAAPGAGGQRAAQRHLHAQPGGGVRVGSGGARGAPRLLLG